MAHCTNTVYLFSLFETLLNLLIPCCWYLCDYRSLRDKSICIYAMLTASTSSYQCDVQDRGHWLMSVRAAVGLRLQTGDFERGMAQMHIYRYICFCFGPSSKAILSNRSLNDLAEHCIRLWPSDKWRTLAVRHLCHDLDSKTLGMPSSPKMQKPLISRSLVEIYSSVPSQRVRVAYSERAAELFVLTGYRLQGLCCWKGSKRRNTRALESLG